MKDYFHRISASNGTSWSYIHGCQMRTVTDRFKLSHKNNPVLLALLSFRNILKFPFLSEGKEGKQNEDSCIYGVNWAQIQHDARSRIPFEYTYTNSIPQYFQVQFSEIRNKLNWLNLTDERRVITSVNIQN